jgi:hypothetical protein
LWYITYALAALRIEALDAHIVNFYKIKWRKDFYRDQF